MIYSHISNCKSVNYLGDLSNISNNSAERDTFDKIMEYFAGQWDILLFKQTLKIKEKCQTLNSGFNAFKELM